MSATGGSSGGQHPASAKKPREDIGSGAPAAIMDDVSDDDSALIAAIMDDDDYDSAVVAPIIDDDDSAVVAPIIDNDAGPKSLIVVVDYDYSDKSPYFCSILQLDIDEENHQGNNDEVIETEFSVHLCLQQSLVPLQPIIWSFSPLGICTEDLYMLPYMLPGSNDEVSVSLHGCIFNLRNKTCKQIKTPDAPRHNGCAVSMGGHLYFMAHPCEKYLSFPVFERHDPSSDCWEPREPFPYFRGITGVILATAVLDDTILFNISGLSICAYNVPNNKWHRVIFEDRLACRIRGEAVVLGNTIYALEQKVFNLVLVFSVGREEINDDLVYRFSLVSKIFVSGMKEIEDEDKDVCWWPNHRHLAYLGNNNFCLVRSNELPFPKPKEYQSIQVINMKLDEGDNSMTVKNTRFYKIKLDDCKTEFRVRLCFSSLLKCTTTAVEEGKPSVVKFDPFPKDTGLKQEQEGDIDCHRDHADTTQATPTPSYHAFPAYRYPPAPPPHYYQPPDYISPHNSQAPAIPSQPPYYQHPAYQYPQAPAVPSPPPYYQHPAYQYPQAPAMPSPPPYYQHLRPHPPNTPQLWPCNPQQPLLLPPTAPKTNNQRPPKPYQDYCQLCGREGHFATNCSTYLCYKNRDTLLQIVNYC